MQRYLNIVLLLALLLASQGVDRSVQGAADTAQPLYTTTDGNLLLPLQGEQQPQIVLSHATDCPANITIARPGNICRDLDDGKQWVCSTPATGGNPQLCDLPGEWTVLSIPGAGGGDTVKSVIIEQLSSSDDDMLFPYFGRNVTIKTVFCNYKGTAPTTGAVFTLKNAAGTTMTHAAPVCTAMGTIPTQQNVTANGAIAAFELMRFSVPNTPNPDASQTYILGVTYE